MSFCLMLLLLLRSIVVIDYIENFLKIWYTLFGYLDLGKLYFVNVNISVLNTCVCLWIWSLSYCLYATIIISLTSWFSVSNIFIQISLLEECGLFQKALEELQKKELKIVCFLFIDLGNLIIQLGVNEKHVVLPVSYYVYRLISLPIKSRRSHF